VLSHFEEKNMLMKNRVSTAAFAVVISASSLLAQTPAQTPVQPPTTATAPAPTTPATPQTQTPAPATPSVTPAQTPGTTPATGTSQMPSSTASPQTGASGGLTPAPLVDSPHGTAIALLDRVQKVLDKAVDGKGDQVTLERGMVDEMRAELTQIKLTLQAEKR
jgi:hypothetical protein